MRCRSRRPDTACRSGSALRAICSLCRRLHSSGPTRSIRRLCAAGSLRQWSFACSSQDLVGRRPVLPPQTIPVLSEGQWRLSPASASVRRLKGSHGMALRAEAALCLLATLNGQVGCEAAVLAPLNTAAALWRRQISNGTHCHSRICPPPVTCYSAPNICSSWSAGARRDALAGTVERMAALPRSSPRYGEGRDPPRGPRTAPLKRICPPEFQPCIAARPAARWRRRRAER